MANPPRVEYDGTVTTFRDATCGAQTVDSGANDRDVHPATSPLALGRRLLGDRLVGVLLAESLLGFLDLLILTVAAGTDLSVSDSHRGEKDTPKVFR